MMNQLKCAHWNVRSLIPHFNDVKNTILLYDLDIIGLSETWLDNTVSNNIINIQGYDFLRFDRLGRGGGVGVYIKSCFKYEIITTDKNIEQIWLKVNVNSIIMAFGVVYRPQTFYYLNFINKFETTLSTIIPLVDDILCLGDFNIDLLDYNHKATETIYDLLDGLGLKQVVNQPTRITDKSASLIDYVLSSKEDLISEVVVKHLPEVSDHELILFTAKYKMATQNVKFKTTRNFKKLNFNQFDADLRPIS